MLILPRHFFKIKPFSYMYDVKDIRYFRTICNELKLNFPEMKHEKYHSCEHNIYIIDLRKNHQIQQLFYNILCRKGYTEMYNN